MGYELRIYVVYKGKIYDEEKRYAGVVAMFNFGKFAGLREVFKAKTDCYIYSDDGNTPILEDDYGDELTEAPLADVISFLENEIKNGENYRRIKPLLSLLKGFDKEQWDNLVCLHYGY